MPNWINLADRAVTALERIADALEAAASAESTVGADRLEERDAA